MTATTTPGAVDAGEGSAAPGITSSLKFSEKAHRYWLDGRPIPGVTTLLKGIPKPALAYWSAKAVAEYVADNPDKVEALRDMGRGPMVNALKGVPWEARDKAAVRGTDVHSLAERLVHGEAVEVPEHLADHVDGYCRWLDRFEPVPLLTERPIGNREHWYAGRFDLIACIGGTTWGLDVKTSAAIYGETAAQLAAYMHAEFYVDVDGFEQPMPAVERYGALHVTESGTTLVPLDSTEAPWRVFLHAAWVFRQEAAIKAFVLDPIDSPEASA